MNLILKDEIEIKKLIKKTQKNSLSKPKLTSQICDPSHEINIIS
jgi:hypothetical protein